MAASENFDKVLVLVEHICEELVDDPSSICIEGTHVGVTGAIEISGPANEIGKIFGTQKATASALEAIVSAVASKYGFRVLLNVINTNMRDDLIKKGEARSKDEA